MTKNILKLRILAIILLAIFAALLILFVPAITKGTPIRIEDKCGKFVNLFSHTIEDKNTCEIRCKSQCGSLDKGYRKVEFKKIEGSCNSCMCYCR